MGNPVVTKAEIARMWFNYVAHHPYRAVRTYQTCAPVLPYPMPIGRLAGTAKVWPVTD